MKTMPKRKYQNRNNTVKKINVDNTQDTKVVDNFQPKLLDELFQQLLSYVEDKRVKTEERYLHIL